MVASLIVVILGAATYFAIFSGAAVRNLEKEKEHLSRTTDDLNEMIRKDIGSSIRVTGATGQGNSADSISGISVTTAGSPASPVLTIYQEAFGELFLPVTGIIAGPDNTQFTIQASIDGAQDVVNFFVAAATKKIFENYVISNSRNTYVFTIQQGEVKSGKLNLYSTTFKSAGMTLNDLQNESKASALILRAAKKITYTTDGGTHLKRIESTGSGKADLVQTLVSAPTTMKINFLFSNALNSVNSLRGMVDGYCQNTNELWGPTLEDARGSCVTDSATRLPNYSDFTKATVEIKIRGEKPLSDKMDLSQTALDMSGFTQDSDRYLVLSKTLSFVPSYYGTVSSSISTVVACTPLSSNRCTKSCSPFFQNTTWNGWGSPPEDWIGYGMYYRGDAPQAASDYCRGAVNDISKPDVITPPELDFSKIWPNLNSAPPIWTNLSSERQDQFNAIARHFGCANFSVMALNPAYGLACTALQSKQNLFLERRQSGFLYKWVLKNPFDSTEGTDNFLRAFDDLSPKLSSSRNASDVWYNTNTPTLLPGQRVDSLNKGRYLNCGSGMLYGNSFLARARPDISMVKSEDLASKNTDIWASKCSCLNYNEDENGNSLGQLLNPYVDFRLLCNLDIAAGVNGSGVYQKLDTPVCPNTWDKNLQAYKMKSDTYSQGMPPDRAALCECLSRYPQPALNAYNSPNWPTAYSRFWDFRVIRGGSTDGNLDPALSGVSATAGSHSAKSVGGYLVTADGLNTKTGQSFTCDVAQAMSDLDGGISICTAINATASPTLNSPRFPNNVAGVKDTFRATHSGYCYAQCVDPDRDKVRDAIATKVNGALPADCGGPTGSSL